jgi:hypothetical protein
VTPSPLGHPAIAQNENPNASVQTGIAHIRAKSILTLTTTPTPQDAAKAIAHAVNEFVAPKQDKQPEHSSDNS